MLYSMNFISVYLLHNTVLSSTGAMGDWPGIDFTDIRDAHFHQQDIFTYAPQSKSAQAL